jgi:radical SAM superfamily enzyme YgiQ (UPF0313 family)
MKICLISPKYTDIEGNAIPQGILSICAAVKSAGYDCDLLDCNLNYRNTDCRDLHKYDVVGLSVFTSQLPHAIEISKKIRGKTKIVWGGIHCLLDPLSILNRFKDDYVISGEGEIPFLKLLEHFSGRSNAPLDSIEGLCYVKDGTPVIAAPYFMKDINTIADINYYDLPHLEKYLKRYNYYFSRNSKVLGIVTGRGCPWDCSFCINSIFRKHKAYHRSKDIAKIRREVEPVIKTFGIEEVGLCDDDFFTNKKLVRDWSEFARENRVLWAANARYNYIKDNMLSAEELNNLSKSGLFALGMSIEAGDERIRNEIINKRLQDADIINAVHIFKKSRSDIVVNTSFVVYFPGDEVKSRIDNIKWMDYLSNNINICFSGPQVYRSYPGSKLYDMEGGQIYGDLSYYVNRLNKDGSYAFEASGDKDVMLFFSDGIRVFFNTRMRQLQLTGHGFNTMKKRKMGSFYIGFMNLLFFSIKIRLKFDYWGFFIEPKIIGKIFGLAASLYKFRARLKGVLR